MILRRYRAEDRAACHAVFYEAVHGGTRGVYDAAQRTAWAPRETPAPGTADRLLDQWCWVAEAEGRILGFMSLRRDGYLDMAFVRPEMKGRGVANALYAQVLGEARTAGLATLTTHASHLARQFFAKQGWRVDYDEDHPINGQVLGRAHMHLEVKEIAHDRPL